MGENKKFAETPKYSAAGVPSPLNVNAKKTAEAYPIAIPEVGDRPTEYANVKANQGNPSAAFKAQHDDIGRFARPLAALLIGFLGVVQRLWQYSASVAVRRRPAKS